MIVVNNRTAGLITPGINANKVDTIKTKNEVVEKQTTVG